MREILQLQCSYFRTYITNLKAIDHNPAFISRGLPNQSVAFIWIRRGKVATIRSDSKLLSQAVVASDFYRAGGQLKGHYTVAALKTMAKIDYIVDTIHEQQKKGVKRRSEVCRGRNY